MHSQWHSGGGSSASRSSYADRSFVAENDLRSTLQLVPNGNGNHNINNSSSSSSGGGPSPFHLRGSLGQFIERSTSAPPPSSSAEPFGDALVGSDLLDHMTRTYGDTVHSQATTPLMANNSSSSTSPGVGSSSQAFFQDMTAAFLSSIDSHSGRATAPTTITATSTSSISSASRFSTAYASSPAISTTPASATTTTSMDHHPHSARSLTSSSSLGSLAAGGGQHAVSSFHNSVFVSGSGVVATTPIPDEAISLSSSSAATHPNLTRSTGLGLVRSRSAAPSFHTSNGAAGSGGRTIGPPPGLRGFGHDASLTSSTITSNETISTSESHQSRDTLSGLQRHSSGTSSSSSSIPSSTSIGLQRPASTGVLGNHYHPQQQHYHHSQAHSSSSQQQQHHAAQVQSALRPSAKTLMDLIQEDFPEELHNNHHSMSLYDTADSVEEINHHHNHHHHHNGSGGGGGILMLDDRRSLSPVPHVREYTSYGGYPQPQYLEHDVRTMSKATVQQQQQQQRSLVDDPYGLSMLGISHDPQQQQQHVNVLRHQQQQPPPQRLLLVSGGGGGDSFRTTNAPAPSSIHHHMEDHHHHPVRTISMYATQPPGGALSTSAPTPPPASIYFPGGGVAGGQQQQQQQARFDLSQATTAILPSGQTIYLNAAPPSNSGMTSTTAAAPYGYTTVQYHTSPPYLQQQQQQQQQQQPTHVMHHHQTIPGTAGLSSRAGEQYVSVIPMQNGATQVTYWQPESGAVVAGQHPTLSPPTVAIVNSMGGSGSTGGPSITVARLGTLSTGGGGGVNSATAVDSHHPHHHVHHHLPPPVTTTNNNHLHHHHHNATPLQSSSPYGTRTPREKGSGGGGRGRRGPASRRSGSDSKAGSGSGGGGGGGGHSLSSPLLEEFRASKNRDWTICQIEGHVVEFCQDQNGSRFIQQRLEMADPSEQQIVMQELLPHIRRLRNDVFGNYVVQKLLDFGTPHMKADIRDTLEGEMLQLSLQMYGCRVVQKALEALNEDDVPKLLTEFRHNVLSCIHDQNGNHVIQKCIEVLNTKSKKAAASGDDNRALFLNDQIEFIIDDVLVNTTSLSCHPYGCRVLQRILEHCDEMRKTAVLNEIGKCHQKLLDDQYGNYVIQHVLQFGRQADRDSILKIVVHNGLLRLSRQKFASNVVEKLLKYGNAPQRRAIVREMLKPANEPFLAPVPDNNNNNNASTIRTVVLLMVRDAYANYVVQTTLDVLSECEEKKALLKELNTHADELKNFTFAKHIVAKLTTMNSS